MENEIVQTLVTILSVFFSFHTTLSSSYAQWNWEGSLHLDVSALPIIPMASPYNILQCKFTYFRENPLASRVLSLTYKLIIYIPGRVLPYMRLMGMCRWMGSDFHDWIDYNGVAFSIELLARDRTFSHFWGKKGLPISR